jgi:hypothetical protein
MLTLLLRAALTCLLTILSAGSQRRSVPATAFLSKKLKTILRFSRKKGIMKK